MRDPESAFRRYEAIKSRLPNPGSHLACADRHAKNVLNLGDVTDQFDVYFFDAFGVLNVGDTVLEEAPKRMAALQDAGKLVYVLTNSASHVKQVHIDKFNRFGFSFADENIVSSREVFYQCLAENTGPHSDKSQKWGLIAICNLDDWPVDVPCTAFDYAAGADNQEFWNADAFVFMSSGKWSASFQEELLAHLKKTSKPVYVANPDIVAPREDHLSIEPGYYAHEILDQTDAKVTFFGKPFENSFDLALSRARKRLPNLDLSRVLMIGDTLHTDILGGTAAGIQTALVTNYGTYKQRDIEQYFGESGITPDFMMPTI